MKKTKLTVSDYNKLFHTAENIIQASWKNLGLTEDEIIKRASNDKHLQKLSKEKGLSPVYWLYKIHANDMVDSMLKELDIEVDDTPIKN